MRQPGKLERGDREGERSLLGLRTFALALLLLQTSCKDEGIERHQKALEEYSACVSSGLPPVHACFADVVNLLETIPKSSTAYARAQALRDALLTAQQPKLRTPLAVQGGQLNQCQRFAEQLGTTAAADRPDKVRELEACRAKAEKLDSAHVHGETEQPH